MNKHTGELLWQTKEFTDGAHYSSLVCAEIAGIKQYVQLTAESVVGIGTDGTVLWRTPRKGRTAVIPTPVIHGNLVYVTSGYGVGCNLFEVQSINGRLQAHQVYAERTIANHHGGVLRLGDYLYGYCDAKGWVCQEMASGDIKWAQKGQIGKGAITYADGRLYLRAEGGGQIGLIEASPEGYKETGRFVQPDLSGQSTWPHPVIANKKLYLRDQDKLFCYDVQAR